MAIHFLLGAPRLTTSGYSRLGLRQTSFASSLAPDLQRVKYRLTNRLVIEVMHHKSNYILNTLPIIIWIVLISVGIKAGLDLADIEKSQEVVPPFPLLWKFMNTFFPLSMGVLASFQYMKTKNSQTLLGKFADRIFGKGFSETFEKKIRLHILGPLSFLLIGFVGLMKAIIFNAPESVIYKVLFPFSFGIGIILPLWSKKLVTRK